MSQAPLTADLAPQVITATTPVQKRVRRWVKVDVSPEVFDHLHDMAHESRMRMIPYLRRFLEEAWSYPPASTECRYPSFAAKP